MSLVDKSKQFSSEEIIKICSRFNGSLPFNAGICVLCMMYGVFDHENLHYTFVSENLELCYAIRDMIIADGWSASNSLQSRGFCKKLTIRSQCYDAGIVLDGGIAVPFNFGTTAVMEIRPEYALRALSIVD